MVATPPAPAYAGPLVADAMITRPHLHPATLTLAEAAEELADSHVHLLLLVDGDRLVGTLDRDDLAAALATVPGTDADDPGDPGSAAALPHARLEGRTAAAADPLDATREAMASASDPGGRRRRAVVDEDGRLVGLLCLKRSGTGFCSDAGVAARAADRRAD